MTAKDLTSAAVSIVVTVLGSMLLLLATGAWGTKENKSDHDRDFQNVVAFQQRILDAVCDAAQVKPRACADPSTYSAMRKP